jgi:predicted ATP-dependent endonuclease of OLD family
MQLKDLWFGAPIPNIAASDGLEQLSNMLKTLSSGQRIVVSLLSDLIQHVDPQSLILFDEPEVYLHPTLLSTLMWMMHELLQKYDAYAIVATHSPIVVQEIPARSVRVFERIGNVPSQAMLPIESFGENLTEIVDHVFHMNEDDKNYKVLLQQLVQEHSYDEIVAMFDDRLGLNARMYLRSLTRRG